MLRHLFLFLLVAQGAVNFRPPDPNNCVYDEEFDAYHCFNPHANAYYYYYADGTFFYPGRWAHGYRWTEQTRSDSRKWTGVGTKDKNDYHYYYHHEDRYYYPRHEVDPYSHHRFYPDQIRGFSRWERRKYVRPTYVPFEEKGRVHLRGFYKSRDHTGRNYYHSYPMERHYTPERLQGWWWDGQSWHWGTGHRGHHSVHRGRQLRDDRQHHSYDGEQP